MLLFDFGAELGDTIIRYDPYKRGLFSGTYYPDSDTEAHRMEMYVSAVDAIDINGENYSITTMTPVDPDSEYFDNRVLNGIGSLSQNFSGDFFFYTADGCDGGFACYKSEDIEYKTDNDFEHPGCVLLDAIKDEVENSIRILPNPFTSAFHIPDLQRPYELNIMDLNGRVVRTASNQEYLDTESLTGGIWFLQIITRKGKSIQRIVKI